MTRKYEKPLWIDLPFDEALKRFAKTDPKELQKSKKTGAETPASVTDAPTPDQKTANRASETSAAAGASETAQGSASRSKSGNTH